LLRAHEEVVLLEGALRDDRDTGLGEPSRGGGHVSHHGEVEGEIEGDGSEGTGLGQGAPPEPAAFPEPFLECQGDLVSLTDEGRERLWTKRKKNGRFSRVARG
jgi:hypothetical protein